VWTLVLTLLPACQADVQVETDVAYDTRFGQATTLDVYSPGLATSPRPAVVLIHGGGWRSFDKDSEASDARRLAGAGYVVFNLNYRLVPDGAFPRDVQDCLCALSWARAHADTYGIDPARIATMGYSAGGHLASLVGVAADDPGLAPDCDAGPTGPPAAVVSGAGPQDMRALPQVSTVTEYLGGTKDEVPAVYDEASPITHVDAADPPFLFVQGEDDWFVDPVHARKMKDALDAVGVTTRILKVPGGGHLWNRGTDGNEWEIPLTSIDTPESQAAIVDFLDHTIGPVP
jgi:acetyl esterase/lipase